MGDQFIPSMYMCSVEPIVLHLAELCMRMYTTVPTFILNTVNYFTMHMIGRHPNHMHYEEYASSHVTLCDFEVISCSILNIPMYPMTSLFISRASTVLLCEYLQLYYKSQSNLGLFINLHRYCFVKSKSYSVKWFQTT